MIVSIAKNALLANSIGVPLSVLYYKFQVSLKQESVNYQQFIQPLVVIVGWTFIIGPIGTVFPILADYFENSSPEFALFAQLAVAYSILIIIISVTVLSIFYSVLLNKEQLELKKKEVLRMVMHEFAENGVFATEEISSLLFVRYVQHRNPIKLEKDLIQGDPINMYEHPEPSENHNIKNILVTKQDYENKMKLEQIQENKREKIRKSLSANITDTQSLTSADTTKQEDKVENHGILYHLQDCLFSCLLCRFGYYDLEQMELNETNKQLEISELKKLKMMEEQRIIYRARIGTERRQSTLIRQDPKYSDQFSNILYGQKAERFWVALYNMFLKQGDFTRLLEILALEKDPEILKQYSSYEEKNEAFTISDEDFGLLLYDNFKDKQQSYDEILKKQAVSNFHRLIKEYPELYSSLL